MEPLAPEDAHPTADARLLDLEAYRAAQAPQPWTLRGQARCLHCRHTWEAVSPEGVVAELECPACHLKKGLYIGLIGPEHDTRWVCMCGCDVFYLLPYGCQCLWCGVVAEGL